MIKLVFIPVSIVTALLVLAWQLRKVFQRQLSRARSEIAGSGERILIPPERAKFTGAARGYGRVRCDGVIAATEKRLLFWRLCGFLIEVVLDQVTGVREERWFRGYFRAGCRHLVVELSDGNQVAFYVANPDRWLELFGETGKEGR